MRDPTPVTIHLKDYTPPAFLIATVDLDVDIRDDHARVRAKLAVKRNPAAKDPRAPLVLDGDELALESAAIDGRPLAASEYALDAEHLTIAAAPDSFTLETVVRIEPQKNTKLMGLYASKDGFFTQCEAEGFRRITFFVDRPDVMARYTTTIHAAREQYPVLLSNGNQVGRGDEAGGRHWVKWEDPFPKPSYLFAMVAAKLDKLEDSFVTRSGRKVTLQVWVEPGKVDQCAWAMQALKKSMKWDEDTFGLELDLDCYMIVAVGDFNMGAMENKGLNIFNTKYVLARPDIATDGDFLNIDRVVAHEYFHNWTGNRVTCRDWFQLSLKEGLTVFRDQEFGADTYSRPVTRIQEVRGLRAAQFPEDAGPMAHPVRPQSYMEISNFYTATVYEKGAEVVRMIHTLIGPRAFRRGMDVYFRRHDGQAVTCDEFVDAMAEGSGFDFAQFKRWYDQAGTPRLDVTGDYDAAAKRYVLTVKQWTPPTPGQPEKLPLHVPLAVGLITPGRDRDSAAARGRADAARHRPRAVGEAGRGALRVHERAGEAGAFAPAPLLRAGDPRLRVHRGRADAPHGARRRPVQPVGGGPAARDRHPAARDRSAPRRETARRAARVRGRVRARPRRWSAGPGVRRRGARAAVRDVPRRADGRRRSGRDPRRARPPPARARARAPRRARSRRISRWRSPALTARTHGPPASGASGTSRSAT